jgi:hypothetical protein
MAYERKKISSATVIASACIAMVSLYLGSLFGTSGTLYGAGISSVIVGVGGTVFENFIRKVHLSARERSTAGARKAARTAGIGLALALVTGGVAFGTLGIIEAASGKTLHSLTTGQQQYGNSFNYQTTPPSSPSFSPSPSYSPPASSPTPSPSVSPSISSSPSISPSLIPSLSPSPALSVLPLSASPSASDSPTP